MFAKVRPAAVAGTFYPESTDVLRRDVALFLSRATHAEAYEARPKALIVPHAGYMYSGQIAAAAFAQLTEWAREITRVVLLGPAHRVAFHGLAIPATDAFVTPLGCVSLDRIALDSIRELPQVTVSDEAHALEHSLEVQLPFLQTVLEGFSLVPLTVGKTKTEAISAVIEQLWGGDETLIVVSSDLSHYLPYGASQQIDGQTAQRILELDPTLGHFQACGAAPINGFLLAAQRRGLQAKLLDLRNSGDTAGDKSRVVGYAAFVFYEDHQNAH